MGFYGGRAYRKHRFTLTRMGNYDDRQKELLNVIDALRRQYGSTGYDSAEDDPDVSGLRPVVEMCPNDDICNDNESCTCDGLTESDEQYERINELEDKILEMKEKIVNLESENASLRTRLRGGIDNPGADLRASEPDKAFSYEIVESGPSNADDREALKNVFREELDALRYRIADKDRHISELEERIKEKEMALVELDSLKVELKGRIETEKKLRHEIVDLKGSIRVFCRVRPTLSGENEPPRIKINDDSITLSSNDEAKPLTFNYDIVFGPSAGQSDVFREVLPLIESGLDGYNVCIFAYGQTGSGKTYTMEGNEESKGILPRSVDIIFSRVDAMVKNGWRVEFVLNVVEIYNETVLDLLSNSGQKVEVKYGKEGMLLEGCTSHKVEAKAGLVELLNFASKNRSIGQTMMNERSSRSHLVVIFKIGMYNEGLKEIRKSSFSFIDLAGSERLSLSGAEGERLKETKNINKSLLSLRNVITAILKGDKHVPFRDSKLTYLLKEHLQGNSRALMIASISPELKYCNETTCTLRFAAEVISCKLGRAHRSYCKEI